MFFVVRSNDSFNFLLGWIKYMIIVVIVFSREDCVVLKRVKVLCWRWGKVLVKREKSIQLNHWHCSAEIFFFSSAKGSVALSRGNVFWLGRLGDGCVCVCMFVCVCTFVCMCVWACVCVCLYVCLWKFVLTVFCSLLCNGLCAPFWRNST